MNGIPAPYQALIDSDRVSARTRAILLDRAAVDDPEYRPQALSVAAFRTLGAVLARVLPGHGLNLAQHLDLGLVAGQGDGWRFAELPPDRAAYAAGLAALDGFADLAPAEQDAWLTRLAGGGDAMAHWFQDLCGDAVKAYVAHPATLARIGYSGIAYGGDGAEKQGFHSLDPGGREPWEPLAADAP